MEKWRDAVPAYEFESAYIYRKFAHRFNWTPDIVNDMDIALVAAFMNDWQIADDDMRAKAEESGGSNTGWAGPGANRLADVQRTSRASRNLNANAAIHEDNWHPDIPRNLSPTRARIYARQHGLPEPKAAVYDIDKMGVIPGRGGGRPRG